MNCNTERCDGDAVARVFWPGRLLSMCGPCALRALRIAAAMGFVLIVQPLPPRADKEWTS